MISTTSATPHHVDNHFGAAIAVVPTGKRRLSDYVQTLMKPFRKAVIGQKLPMCDEIR